MRASADPTNRCRRSWLLGAVVLLVGTVLPTAASAHSPIPGIGRFYSGALHPFVVPAQWMALLALGLLLGQRGMMKTGLALTVLLLALVAGLGIGFVAHDVDTDALLLACCAVLALVVVLALPLPQWLLALAGAVVGVAIGLSSAPDGLSGWGHAGSLAGSAFGALLFTLWIVAMTEFAQRPWPKIIVRVLGSWLAASALLVLALSWVGPRRAVKAVAVPAASAPPGTAATASAPR